MMEIHFNHKVKPPWTMRLQRCGRPWRGHKWVIARLSDDWIYFSNELGSRRRTHLLVWKCQNCVRKDYSYIALSKALKLGLVG